MLKEKSISQSRIFDSEGNEMQLNQNNQTIGQVISSNTYLTKLIQFQDNFINLVHRQIYGTNKIKENQHSSDGIVKFQINHITQYNQYFNKVIKQLSEELIQKKKHYDPILRQYFVKVISSMYMPLFRVNRYQLTKLSLYGFDIYIDPLRSILQIINRIDHQKSMLIQQTSQQIMSAYNQNENCWTALDNCWQNFLVFQQLWQISFHIYLLKQYLSLAGTSLFKKDKQIIFTGCSGLFHELIPWLCKNKLVNMLKELASLNNVLYEFHASHNYFQLYSLIPPLDEFLAVFQNVKQLENKCKSTNILTPLLFGILRNYKAFSKFIDQIPNQNWIRYLNILLSGLIINFKIRILQYSQLLDLTCKIIQKLGILGQIKLSIISSNISLEWMQARQFFISAFKSGYNSGQIQTWHPIEQTIIQPTLRQSLISALFLLPQPNEVQYVKGLERIQIIAKLDKQIINLSQKNQTFLTISSGWKTYKRKSQLQKKKFQDNQKVQSTQKQLQKKEMKQQFQQQNRKDQIFNKLSYCLIRSINMIQFLDNVTQPILYFLLSAINYFFQNQQNLNIFLRQRIITLSDKINQMITIVNRKQISISTLKQSIFKFHKYCPPNNTFSDIVPVYLYTSIPKDSISMLLQIVSKSDQHLINKKMQQLSIAIIHRYFYNLSDQVVKLKSFETQFKLQSDLLLIDPKTNAVLITLVEIYVKKSQSWYKYSVKLIQNIISVCEWVSIPILGLPVNHNDKLESLLTCLLKQNESQNLLQSIINHAFHYFQTIQNVDIKKQTQSYLRNFYSCWIQDQIIREINLLCQIQKNQEKDKKIILLISLQFKLYKLKERYLNKKQITQNEDISEKMNQRQNVNIFWNNIIKLITFLMEKNSSSKKFILQSINLYIEIFNGIESLNIKQWYITSLYNLCLANSSQNFSKQMIFNPPQIKTSSKSNYYYSIIQQEKTEKMQQKAKLSIGIQKIKQKMSQSCNTLSQNNKICSQQLLQQFQKWRQTKQLSIKNSNTSNLLPPIINSECLAEIINEQKIFQKYSLQLQILKLNPKNAQIILNYAIKEKKLNLLKEIDSLKLISKVFNQIFSIQKVKKEQNQNGQIQVKTQIQNLNLQQIFSIFNNYSFQILSQISSQFQLYKLNFKQYLTYSSELWFLAVCNNMNWRYFVQQISQILKQKNLPSLLLQYQQFINITNSPNNQYDLSISQFLEYVQIYNFMFKKKNQFLEYLIQNDSTQQISIRKLNQVASLNVISSKCQFQDIIKKIYNFYIITQNKPFQIRKTLKQLFILFKNINHQICHLAQGFIVFPSFTSSNSHTTSILVENKFELGVYLEENMIQQQLQDKYVPNKKGSHLKNCQISIQQYLKNIKQGSFNMQELKMYVFCSNSKEKDKNIFEVIFNQLKQKNVVQIKGKQIFIQTPIQNHYSYLAKIYLLGALFDLVSQQIKLSPLLAAFLKRQKLQIELIKEYNLQCYHHLKSILMTDNQQLQNLKQSSQDDNRKISSKFVFTYEGQDLLPNGSNIQVNKLNKNYYIDLITRKVLGKQFLQANQTFVLGILNNRYMKS